MEELYNIGLTDESIKEMVNIYPDLREITSSDVIEKKQLLEKIGCDDGQIINIISYNPLYISRSNYEIEKLFDYFIKIGFNSLNILIDSNPNILNLEVFEIEDYINKKKADGLDIEDIIDELDSNPFLFNDL